MKKLLLLLLTVVLIHHSLTGKPSRTSNTIQFVLLDLQGENQASNWKVGVRDKHIQRLQAPGSFDRSQLNSFKADQIRHALEQKNALDDKPLNKSYYLVLDFQPVEILLEANQSSIKDLKSMVQGYLFKVDKNSNNRRVYKTAFPLTYVASTIQSVEVSGPIGKTATTAQLIKELVQKGFDQNLDSMQAALEFYVEQAPIAQVNPIRANIGKREGIRTDDRFFAYDYVYNTKTFKTEKVFRGVVRATNHIADNLENPDSAGSSTFYQTFGSPLKPGYMLVKNKNSGYEWSMMHSTGSVEGWSGRLDLRMSRHTGIRGMFLYFEAGLQKEVIANHRYLYGPYTLYRLEGGLAKGFRLNRLMELRPYAGIGEESTVLDFKYGFFSEYYKLGANLSINILPFLQVFGGYGYYQFSNIRNTINNDDMGIPWSVGFPGRVGGNTVFGIKFEL